MNKIATPIFVRDIETAKKLIADAKGAPVINVFVLDHNDAIDVISQLGKVITVQPVKHFGDKAAYIEAPEQLTSEYRKTHMHRLAGQVFTSTYQGVDASFKITKDGLFKSLITNEIYKSPSTALAMGWEGRVKGKGVVNGYYHPKNKAGNSIDEELKQYIERGE